MRKRHKVSLLLGTAALTAAICFIVKVLLRR